MYEVSVQVWYPSYLMKRTAILLAIAGMACSAMAQNATVYVYRYRQLIGRAAKPAVSCDGSKLANIVNGRYFAVSVPPGKHVFRSRDKQSVVAIDAKPGHEYFIRAYNIWTSGGMLMTVDDDTGRAELSTGKLKPLDAKEVFAKDRVSTEPVRFAAEAKSEGQ